MIIELSDFFNNPSLISLGGLTIQYYAITWLLSAVFIYLFLKYSPITKELGLTKEQVNDLVFLYGLIFGAMIGGRIGYMLFYGWSQLMMNPLKIFFIWEVLEVVFGNQKITELIGKIFQTGFSRLVQ